MVNFMFKAGYKNVRVVNVSKEKKKKGKGKNLEQIPPIHLNGYSQPMVQKL